MPNALFEIHNHVTEREFVNSLNAKYLRAAIERFEEIYWVSPNAQTLQPGSYGWQLPASVTREEVQPIRASLIGLYLRMLVDTWLDSGRKPDGSESPIDRELTGHIRQPDGSAAGVFSIVLGYLERYPPFRPELNTRGIEIEIASPDAVITELGAAQGPRDFFEAQTWSALRLFVGMLASDWKERIGKCRDLRCGKYFLIAKARGIYRNGTFCSRDHANRTAAARSMQKNRTKGTRELIEEAARYLAGIGAGPDWVVDPVAKSKVASQLCMVIARSSWLPSYRNEVKRNWVTLHQDAIEQRRRTFHRHSSIAVRR